MGILARAAKPSAAVVLSFLLALSPLSARALGGATVSSPRSAAAPIPGAPAGLGSQAGVAVLPALSFSYSLSEVPTQGAATLAAVPVLAAEAPLAAALPAAGQAAPHAFPAEALERHPVIGILNAIQHAGVPLPENADGRQLAAQLEAAAGKLGDGKAKDDLLAFAKMMSGPQAGAAASVGAAFDNAASRSELTPAVEAPKASGFWAWTARLSDNRALRWTGLSRYAADKAEAARPKAEPIEVDRLRVPIEKLRWTPDLAGIPASTREVEPGEGQIVGQDRALSSLEFGLRMSGDRYNVMVSGPDGSGRETAARHLLAKIAPTMPTPPDRVWVTNFADKKNPLTLELPSGAAPQFARAVKVFVRTLGKVLPRILGSGQLAEAKQALHKEWEQKVQAATEEATRAVAAIQVGRFGLTLRVQDDGHGNVDIGAGVTIDGEPVPSDALEKTVQEKGLTMADLQAALPELQGQAQPILEKFGQAMQANQAEHQEVHEKMDAMDKEAAQSVVDQLGGPLRQFVAQPKGDHNDAGHKAWKLRMKKRRAELDGRYKDVEAGPFRLTIQLMTMGQAAIPMPVLSKDGQELEMEQIQAMVGTPELPADAWENIQGQIAETVRAYVAAFQEMQALNSEEHAKLHENDPKPTEGEERAAAYVEALLGHALEHYQAFLGGDERQGPQIDPADFYRVSVQATHAKDSGAPYEFVKSVSLESLFGTMEEKQQTMAVPGVGMVRIDDPGGPEMKTGAVLRNNGGYVAMNLMDALRAPGVWGPLMRLARDNEAEVSEGGLSAIFGASQKYAVPVRVKLVFFAPGWLADLIEHYDQDYANNFKAKAELESTLEIGADAIGGYLRFIKKMVGLMTGEVLDLTRQAVGGVLEHAARMADSNEKLSARFGAVLDLLREASYFAKQAGQAEVRREDVDKALEQRLEREGMHRRRMQELYWKDVFHVQTEGEAVGQLNALTVYGDFGLPTRVTAAVVPGDGKAVVALDRETGAAGRSFVKGVEEITTAILSLFASDGRPFPAQVRIAKEQLYSDIDGDSSTSTNFYAAVSAISETPFRQGIAMTGSMDQKFNVQPIGGVNEKIEGYFDVVVRKLKEQGKSLDGTHGIIIPRSNVSQLMLRPDVVEAVRQGKFVIYAVDHAFQAIEILSGKAFSEVRQAGQRRLERMRAARRGAAQPS